MSSTVPAVLAALLNLTTSAVGSGVGVVDGQPLPNQYGDFVAVGWNNNGPAVQLVQMPGDAALRGNRETYEVHSQVVSWQGEPGQAGAVRQRVFDLLDLIVAAVEADPQLGGACALAQLIASDYQPVQTGKGAMATVTFTFHIDAWRTA